MSAMIRTLARQLNTRNPVMSRTLIRKYNTDTNVQPQSKFRNIDKGKLFRRSMLVGGIVGFATGVGVYKEEVKGLQPNLDKYVITTATTTIAFAGYFITIPMLLGYFYVHKDFYLKSNGKSNTT
jgi:hypothetical protein